MSLLDGLFSPPQRPALRLRATRPVMYTVETTIYCAPPAAGCVGPRDNNDNRSGKIPPKQQPVSVNTATTQPAGGDACRDCASYSGGDCSLHGATVRGSTVGRQCFKRKMSANVALKGADEGGVP